MEKLAREMGFPRLVFFPVFEGRDFDMKELEKEATLTEEAIKDLLASLRKVEKETIGVLQKHHLDDQDTLKLFDFEEISGAKAQWVTPLISIRQFHSSAGSYIALRYKGGQLPETVQDFGKSFYVHNDFSCPAHYVSIPEALELSELLPEYMTFFKEELQRLKAEAESAKKATQGLRAE